MSVVLEKGTLRNIGLGENGKEIHANIDDYLGSFSHVNGTPWGYSVNMGMRPTIKYRQSKQHKIPTVLCPAAFVGKKAY